MVVLQDFSASRIILLDSEPLMTTSGNIKIMMIIFFEYSNLNIICCNFKLEFRITLQNDNFLKFYPVG